MLSSIKVICCVKLTDNKPPNIDLTFRKVVSLPPHTKVPNTIRQVLRSTVKMMSTVNKFLKRLSPDLKKDLLGFPRSCLQFLGPFYRWQIFPLYAPALSLALSGFLTSPQVDPNSPLHGPQNQYSAMIIASGELFASWFVPCPHSSHPYYSITSLPCAYRRSKTLLMGCEIKVL